MWRFLAGVFSTLAGLGAGFLIWSPSAETTTPVQSSKGYTNTLPLAAGSPEMPEDLPEASEKTREQKRFDRYDRDNDGKILRDEYLWSRKRAYAKLDSNGDGRLTFDEWALKTTSLFQKADQDRDGILDAEEFVATRTKSSQPKKKC